MLKKMKIGTKLIFSFGIIWIMVAGLAVTSIANLSRVASQTEEFYETAHAGSVVAWQARRDIRFLEGSIYNALATEDDAATKAAIEQVNQSGTSFNAALATLKEYFPEKKDILDSAIATAKSARPSRDRVLELAMVNKNAEALVEMEKNYMPALNSVLNIVGEVGEYAEEEAKGFVVDAARTSRQSMIWMVAVSALAAVVIMVFTKLLTKSIAVPAKKISDRIVLLSNGDLKSPMPVIGNEDEIGVLAKATEALVAGIQFMIGDMHKVLTQMSEGNLAVEQSDIEYKGDFLPLQTALRQILQSLNSTLAQINTASDEVSSGADQVSDGAQTLSQGATEQASSIEELSASISEISTKLNESAANAESANEVANHATIAVAKGNEEMQSLAIAINEINQKSMEIGKIIKTIEDIAFQTNILALNAAVEAARAGAAGKGFAVVADEVRNLASKSSEAAKSTTVLIEESIKAVQNGTRLANETAKHLDGIVEGANETTVLIGRLTKASLEQAKAIEQINIGIDHISAVVQNNSATSEESAAASEELSGQADLLKSLVKKFQLLDVNMEKFM